MSIFPGTDKREKIVEQTLLENYDKYFRLAYSYVHNEADACDIVQNGAYKAILKAASLRRMEYAATWVYRIMLNETFRMLGGRQEISLDEAYAEQACEDVYEDVDLQKALNGLSREDKLVVQLRYFEDLKLEEIARLLDENLSTVKSRLYRSMKKLRCILEAEDCG